MDWPHAGVHGAAPWRWHRACFGVLDDARSRAHRRRRPRRLSGRRAQADRRDPLAARSPLAVRDRGGRLGGRHQRLAAGCERRASWRGHPRDRAPLVRAARRAGLPHRRARARPHRPLAGARLRARRAARPHQDDRALSTPPRSRRCSSASSRRAGSTTRSGAATLYAVAVTATSYHSGRSFTFVQGRPGHPVWVKSRRVVLPVTLTHRHVLASSAIPDRVPAGAVASEAGELWFGDGGLRLVTPLSPAIRLGASHLLAVGVRSSRAADEPRARGGRRRARGRRRRPPLALPAARAGDAASS